MGWGRREKEKEIDRIRTLVLLALENRQPVGYRRNMSDPYGLAVPAGAFGVHLAVERLVGLTRPLERGR